MYYAYLYISGLFGILFLQWLWFLMCSKQKYCRLKSPDQYINLFYLIFSLCTGEHHLLSGEYSECIQAWRVQLFTERKNCKLLITFTVVLNVEISLHVVYVHTEVSPFIS